MIAATRMLATALTAFGLAAAAQAQDTDWRAPFITTPDDVVERMLALAGTGADDFVMDLGSGDGRIVIAAAKQFGARGLGVDIDARLVAQSRENARRAGVAERVSFEEREETMRIAKRHQGQGNESRIFLWVVPAEVRGVWQGRDWRLRIAQNYQKIEIEGDAGGRPLAVKEAKLEGTAIRFSGEGFEYRGRVGTGRIVGELQRGGTAVPLVLTKQ